MMKKLPWSDTLTGALLLILIITVSVKLLNHKDFQPNAEKWAAASLDGSNVLQATSLIGKSEKLLIIDLDKSGYSVNNSETMNHSASEILERKSLKKLRKFDGKVALFSSDPALKARMWMILSQMGIRNLVVLE